MAGIYKRKNLWHAPANVVPVETERLKVLQSWQIRVQSVDIVIPASRLIFKTNSS